MMSSPTDSGSVPVQQSNWWLETWRNYICAALAMLEALMAIPTFISVFPSCIITGIVQLLAAIVTIAIEAPAIVSFLRFAQPIGSMIDTKPQWMKAVFYVIIALIPSFFGCVGFTHWLGIIAGLGVAAVYGMIILGPKASRDQMKFQAGSVPAGGQPYSPTSP
ncbi:calcium channel flower-like protein [Dinothrombium tinctorium]|uniref:Calcium channel flower n=1 Tax=Dinothrombium tinctorium TaxID=1965070 RepID=A0A443RDD3_9ACAR|nr:calcium channel flower-like protein [Dinothrombium tinctorium]